MYWGADSDDSKKAWSSLLFHGTYLVISSGVAPVKQHAGHVVPVLPLQREPRRILDRSSFNQGKNWTSRLFTKEYIG
jgi:hypothetical protein